MKYILQIYLLPLLTALAMLAVCATALAVDDNARDAGLRIADGALVTGGSVGKLVEFDTTLEVQALATGSNRKLLLLGLHARPVDGSARRKLLEPIFNPANRGVKPSASSDSEGQGTVVVKGAGLAQSDGKTTTQYAEGKGANVGIGVGAGRFCSRGSNSVNCGETYAVDTDGNNIYG